MKVLLAIFIQYTYLIFNLQAQDLYRPVIVKQVHPNPYSKKLFMQHPTIEKNSILFGETTPDHLTIYAKQDSSTTPKKYEYPGNSYDLKFEGDLYLFAKKYKQEVASILPRKEVERMSRLQQCRSNYTITADMFRDSVVYNFKQTCYVDDKQNSVINRPENGVWYDGDLRLVARRMEENYDPKRYGPVKDSVFIFLGFVDRESPAELRNIRLIAGSESPFADFVRKELQNSGKHWKPAQQGGGRTIRSDVPIFAGLNKDESITLSISSMYH